MKRVFFLIFVFIAALATDARSEEGLGPATILGGGGTNSGASPTIETDEFTGATTYTLQIPVPPARGGVSPNLVLNYNSYRRNLNSWVGLGWELDIGSIVRSPTTVDNDIYTGVIDYDKGTEFEVRLGGQSETLSLVKAGIDPKDYGVTNQTGLTADLYQAKIESSFTSFFHVRSKDASEDYGWTAIDKSGIRYSFGNSKEAQDSPASGPPNAIQRWLLSTISDPNSNTVNVTYNWKRVLSEIEYQDIKIKFSKTSGAPYFPSFREEIGNKDQLGVSLSTVEILQGSKRLQKFKFTYALAPFREARSLVSVQQFGATDDEAMPPVEFDYYGETPMEFAGKPATWQAGYGDLNGLVGKSVVFADMNGDGLVDQVIAKEDGNFVVRFNNGNDFVYVPGKSVWSDPFECDSYTDDDPPCKGKLNAYREGHQWLYLMDMNGDALPDRVGRVYVSGHGSDNETANLRIAFNTGSGWDPNTVEWRDPYVGKWAGTSDQDKAFIDVNGDGLLDRIVGNQEFEYGVQKLKGFRVYYNTGAGFKKEGVAFVDPLSQYLSDNPWEGKIFGAKDKKTYVFIRDMNGDGLPDRVWNSTYHENGVEVGKSFSIAMNTNGRGWALLKINAEGFNEVDGIDNLNILDPVADEESRSALDYRHDWIDVNGDGFLDRVEGSSVGSFNVYFYRGMQVKGAGATLSSPITLNDPVVNGAWASDGVITGTVEIDKDDIRQHTFFQDFNGDGLPDRFVLHPSPGDPVYSMYHFYPLRVNQVVFSDKPDWWEDSFINQPVGNLKEVRDGRGSKTAIEYHPSTRPMKEDQPNHRFLPFNLHLVHKVYSLDPTLQAGDAPFSSLPEAQRHPGMRWTTYRFRGGNFFIRYAIKANDDITDDALSRTRFSRFNGFQEVVKSVVKGPGETWAPYATTSFYRQAAGDVGPSPADLTGVFDPAGYGHFGLSGKPYRQVVQEDGKTVVEQSSTWTINPAGDSDFDCLEPDSGADLCTPRLQLQSKKVWEKGNEPFRLSRLAYEYDSFGNITKETSLGPSDEVLLATETTYYPPSSVFRIKDRPQIQTKSKNGVLYRKKTFEYDSQGNPIQETFHVDSGVGQTLSILRTFNQNGTLKSITDINGLTKQVVYDADGLFPVEEHLIQLTVEREFSRLDGEIAKETNPQGVSESTVSDGFGRPVEQYIHSKSQAKQLVRKYAYEYVDETLNGWNGIRLLKTQVWEPQPGYPASETEPAEVTYQGASGEILQSCHRSERGNYRLVQYRVRDGGRKELQTEPVFSDTCVFLPTIPENARVTVQKKDLLGRVVSVEPPEGDGSSSAVEQVSIAYHHENSENLIKTITGPKNQTRIETYDVNDRLIKVQDANGSPTTYEYNPVGDLTKVVADGAVVSQIDYDLLGRKTKMTDADMGTWQYEYDDKGRLWKQTDAKGQVIEHLYDFLGRIKTKKAYLAGNVLERSEVYSYDNGDAGYDVLKGELYKVEEFDAGNNLTRSTRYGYDPEYRRAAKISRNIPSLGEFTQKLTHDYRGKVTETTYPGGHKLLFGYMRNGNLETVCGGSCDPAVGDKYFAVDPQNVDVFGAVLSEEYGNGVKSDYEYFPKSHRLKTKKTSRGTDVYNHREYTHDAVSNITSLFDKDIVASTSGTLKLISYDNLNRLTGFQFPGSAAAHAMEYDARGNIKKNTLNFGDKEYKYESPRLHAVTSIGTDTFDYDANGNMTKDPYRTMEYNARNQLAKVTMTNGTAVDYDYDYTGARVSKKATREDLYHRIFTATTHYLGDAVEVRGDQVILHVHAGPRKVATRTLGKVQDVLAAGSTLIDKGIDLSFRPAMALPYLFLLAAIFLIASFRPMPRAFPIPAFLQVMYREWRFYQQSLRETLLCFPQRATTKAFLVFFIILSVVQSSTPLLAGESGEPKTPASDSDFFYYVHDDHLGSSHVLTEGKQKGRHAGIVYAKGDILQRIEYAPFGQERYVLNPNLHFDPSYTGQLYDLDTGLYYYKSRYYNPQLGRFIQPDTIVPDAKNLQAYNRYAYVANNPLKYVDPTGHFWGWFKKIFGAFIGALISVLTGFVLAPFVGAFWAGVIGGAIGGVIGGAISGGLKGALLGGLLGAAAGAVFGAANIGLTALKIGGEARFAILAGVGASISAATGGWKGLVLFGAGLAGAAAGYGIGKPIGTKIQAAKNNPFNQLNHRPNRPHISYGERQYFSALRANLGPDAGPLLAWGYGGDVTAGAGGGVFAGGRISAAGGVVHDVGNGLYSFGTVEAGASNFGFGGSASAGAEFAFYTGSIGEFSGSASTLTIAIAQYSLSVTPGSNGGVFFTIGVGGVGGGFEASVIESHTIVKPWRLWSR